jgi:hypothetical protein
MSENDYSLDLKVLLKKLGEVHFFHFFDLSIKDQISRLLFLKKVKIC